MTQPQLDLSLYGLRYNPFEAAGSGPPIEGASFMFSEWRDQLMDVIKFAEQMPGPKAYALTGEYGSGKSYILHWLANEVFGKRRIKAFVFDNPGVEFYKLANDMLNKIGREEFSKSLWEYLRTISSDYQPMLFTGMNPFRAWLQHIKQTKQQEAEVRKLSDAIRKAQITENEEIAYKLGYLVVQTADKPYFEYRDFVSGRSSLVAENEEAPYLAALIRCILRTNNADGVAFLIDEFEEISLFNRLTRKQAYEYLSTLKRLINITGQENLWIIVSMTPQVEGVSRELEPALWARFINGGNNMFRINPLDDAQAEKLVKERLKLARLEDTEPPSELWPFPPNLLDLVREDIKSSPRSLIKLCSAVIARAIVNGQAAPLDESLIQAVALEPSLSQTG